MWRDKSYMSYYEFPRGLQSVGLQVTKCILSANKIYQKGSSCKILLTWTTVFCVRSWILANTPHITQRQTDLHPSSASNASMGNSKGSQIIRRHRTVWIPTINTMNIANQPKILSHLTSSLNKNRSNQTLQARRRYPATKGGLQII